MSTRQTVETWVERFNASDAAGIAALYAEDARGCGFFQVRDDLIVHQRGYWDSTQLNEIHPDVHTD
jgi:ketosteroid isomerase-like protein